MQFHEGRHLCTHITFEQRIDLHLDRFRLAEQAFGYSLFLQPSLTFTDPIDLCIAKSLGPTQDIAVVVADVGSLDLGCEKA